MNRGEAMRAAREGLIQQRMASNIVDASAAAAAAGQHRQAEMREVQQRMAEVQQALATAQGLDGGPHAWSGGAMRMKPPAYDAERNHLADECGRLRDENRQLLAENALLRRKLDRVKR